MHISAISLGGRVTEVRYPASAGGHRGGFAQCTDNIDFMIQKEGDRFVNAA